MVKRQCADSAECGKQIGFQNPVEPPKKTILFQAKGVAREKRVFFLFQLTIDNFLFGCRRSKLEVCSFGSL
jgi:hypothetical protein